MIAEEIESLDRWVMISFEYRVMTFCEIQHQQENGLLNSYKRQPSAQAPSSPPPLLPRQSPGAKGSLKKFEG